MDDDGNVSTLIIDIYRYNGNRVIQINEPIEGVTGQTSGRITIAVSIEDPLVAGYYYFELYVMDATDRESNILTGTFNITS